MIGRYTIDFDMNASDLIEVLKKIRITRKVPMKNIVVRYKWTNFRNPEKLELIDMDFEHMNASKCFGKVISRGSASSLVLQFRPAIALLVIHGLFLCLVGYGIIKFGIHNYGTDGFWPSVLAPAFLVGMIYVAWFFMFLSANKNMRNAIADAVEERTATYELRDE
jgi:hypothetical protein